MQRLCTAGPAGPRCDMVDLGTPLYRTVRDAASLDSIAQASGGASYDATDPASIDRVMINVLSSF